MVKKSDSAPFDLVAHLVGVFAMTDRDALALATPQGQPVFWALAHVGPGLAAHLKSDGSRFQRHNIGNFLLIGVTLATADYLKQVATDLHNPEHPSFGATTTRVSMKTGNVPGLRIFALSAYPHMQPLFDRVAATGKWEWLPEQAGLLNPVLALVEQAKAGMGSHQTRAALTWFSFFVDGDGKCVLTFDESGDEVPGAYHVAPAV